MDRGKPYDRSNQRSSGWKKSGGGDSSSSARCYKCGETGHRMVDCKSNDKKCFKCGKFGHVANDCRVKVVTCYNCGEEGHTRPQCTKPKKQLVVKCLHCLDQRRNQMID